MTAMERLSGLDSTFLYLETPSQLLHVCGLIVLDVSTVPGGYNFAAFKTELTARVRSMPGFRRKLLDSALNLDHPAWVEDTQFDIDRHVHRVAVPAPGGRAELADLCGHIASQQMDRTIPLWEMWVIEGLDDGSVAIMSKMHHANVDGVTGASMMAQLCGLTPDAPRPESDPDQPRLGRREHPGPGRRRPDRLRRPAPEDGEGAAERGGVAAQVDPSGAPRRGDARAVHRAAHLAQRRDHRAPQHRLLAARPPRR